MSLSEKLELLVSMDPSKAVAGFKEIGDKAEQAGKSTESSMNKIGSAATKVGIAGMGVGAMLTDLGSKEQASSQQMEASISAVGQSYDEFKGRIESTISSQEKFGHSAVDTQDAVSKLTMAYGDTGKALDQMQLVADLAAAKHISLADAANIVAKAHGGAGRVFKEFGIQVGVNADGTKNYDGALTELSGKLQGQASAASDTFMGHLKALGTEVEDHIAKFGEKYGPAILMVSTAMTAFGTISSGVTDVLGKLKAAREAETLAATAEKEAGMSTVGMLGGVAVALGIAALAYEGYTHAEQESIDVKNTDKASTADLTKAFNEVPKSVFGMNAQLDYFGKIAESNIGTAQRLRDGLAAQGKDVSALDAILHKASEAQKQATADQQAGAGAAADNAKAMDEAGKAADGFAGFMNNLAGAMEKTYQSSVAGLKADSDYHAKIDDLTKALKDNGVTLDDSTEKGRKNIDAVLASGDSIAKLIERRFQETHSVEAATASGNMYVENLKNQLAAAGLNTEQIDTMISTMKLTPDDIKTSFTNNAVEQQVVIGKYLQQLKDVPPEQRTQFETEINQGQYDLVNQQLNDLAAGRTVTLYPVAGPADAPLQNILDRSVTKFDVGGLVNAPRGQGVPAVVHGGEYVMTAAMVDAIKAGKGMQAGFGSGASSGTGGVAVNLNLTGLILATNKRDLDALGAALSDGVRRELLKTSARNPAGVIGLL